MTSLGERLSLLRGQPPPADPAPEVAGGTGLVLAERLRRLSAARPASPPVGQPDEAALAARLGAERIFPGVLRLERRRPLIEPHGRAALTACAEALPALAGSTAGCPDGWRFIDTETSGLAGGTGTWAFLFGVARIKGGDLVLRQYLLTRLDAEAAYLEAVSPELAATLLVTYNGKCFDAPLLATRLRLAGMAWRADGQPHLDLLGPVRRAFGRVWPDCRLVTAEKRLLGFRRGEDVPGSEAPAAWLAWLRQGETGRLSGVLEHNRRDLVSLPALVPALAGVFEDPAAAGADVRAVAAHHAGRGDPVRARRILEAHRDRLCSAGLAELARLHRAAGDWAAALGVWRALAGQGDPVGLEALAKHLEHQERDYAGALAIATRLPAGPERDRRCRRLEKKLGAGLWGAVGFIAGRPGLGECGAG